MSSNERLDNGLINDNTEICGDGCTGIEDEQNAGSEDIEEPFDPSKLRVDTKTLTIDLLVSRIERNEIDLNPEFQRKGGIWKDPVRPPGNVTDISPNLVAKPSSNCFLTVSNQLLGPPSK